MNTDELEPKGNPAGRSPIPWRAAFYSTFLPGSGQFASGARSRGVGLLAILASLIAVALWYGETIILAPAICVWLWNVWDAYQIAKGGSRRGWGFPVAMTALAVYVLGISVTEIRLHKLATGWPAMQPYLRSLVQPELLAYPTEDIVGTIPVQVPCIDPLPDPGKMPSEAPRVTLNAACGQVGDVLVATGSGFFPETEGELRWANPIGDLQRVIVDGEPATFITDENGDFEVQFRVPQAVSLTKLPGPGETQTHVLRAEQYRPYGSLQMTETLSLVVEKIGETIALAFIATVLGMVFALPVSFLAARNLMWEHSVTRVIYYVVRTLLNVFRSIETLMWAIVFAVWVGLGPFGGMLALMLHSIAALGKLYSEAIESIDPGPIEAIRATGASWPQIVVYAVLPQILPTLSSFTLYRWDINVRMSTVIGLISDAGLGFLVIQWIRLNRLASMSTAIMAIVIVVALLDFVSAWLRKRIIAGTPRTRRASPTRRALVAFLLVAIFAACFVWSWGVAEIDLLDFVEGAPAGLRLARAFLVPEMFTRPTEEQSASSTLRVPCTDERSPVEQGTGPQVSLSTTCGAVGDPLVIRASDLPPNTEVSVRWQLPDGAYLRVHRDCCTTDDQGALEWETTIHPLMDVSQEADAKPGQVSVTWKKIIGGPQLSQAFKSVVKLSVVTLLMALMATTLGSVLAIPLSFLAARNIMGERPLGRTIYSAARTIFNLWRSVEPMILALICSAWVGPGPFAGVLALAINNIPNLAKLFSETIEQIDSGPVEAVTATGANRLQTLVYAVIPQLVPGFLAFILYQWDINIRMSTVIGFVGGGGIGQQFRLWVQMNQYSAAGMATWSIVAMVWSMDYLSAKARERLV